MTKGKEYQLWGHGNDSPPPDYKSSQTSVGESTETLDTVTSSEADEDRGQWGSKAEFILSCVGLSVGLGNVWRFPYLAYEHGGAAFVIAYLILQFLIGKPMYFMELVLGQYSAKGPTAVWAMVPCAKGIGIAMAMISLIVAIYYNVIMGYTLYYFFASMQKTLPWTVCKEEWIPLGCMEQTVKAIAYCTGNSTTDAENCRCTSNATLDTVNCTQYNFTGNPKTAAELFFYEEVIQRSDSFEDMGAPLWKLALCLLASWIVVVACLIKGVKSSGKVVYFTATFPYVILLVLLVRGATLDGALKGIEYFIIPKWDKLLDLKVWAAAAGQMFFSLSVSFGGIIMFGSYNKFKNNVYADAMFIAVMDLVTSMIAGIVIFTTFGGMAKKIGVEVEDVAKGGYGLAFVAYPEALSNLPISQLWSAIFFFMLFTLGLDSEFALLETVLTCVQDEFPKLRKYKSVMCIGSGICCFFLALTCVTPGGDYVVALLDTYGATWSVLVVATCESIAVMWIYGVRRFVKDVEYMLGKSPTPVFYWAFCWTFCAPVLIAALFVYSMVKYETLKFGDGSFYPVGAEVGGWIMFTVVVIPIPAWFIGRLIFARQTATESGTIATLMFHPTSKWRPNDGKNRPIISARAATEKEGHYNIAVDKF